MDDHYRQVMTARDAAGEGTRLYFAYSTILDREAFLEWRDQHGYDFFDLPSGAPLASAAGQKLVFDFPSRYWGGRVAGLAEGGPSDVVWGRLFQVSEKDWPIVRHKEGAVTGMCVERPVTVEVEGQQVTAIAFTTNPVRASLDGPVSLAFLEAWRRGARQAGLPEAYVAAVEG